MNIMKSNWKRILGIVLIIYGGLGTISGVVDFFDQGDVNFLSSAFAVLMLIVGINLWRKGTDTMKSHSNDDK